MGDVLKTFFGGSENSSQSTQSSGPWGPQQEFLTEGFGEARNIYNDQKGTPFYEGDLYAGLNDRQNQGLDALSGWGQGTGQNLAGATSNAALSGLSNTQGLYDFLNNTLSGNQSIGNSQTNQNLSNQGSDLLSQGSAGLSRATENGTASNLAAAQSYVNSDLLNSQIDAVGDDISRNLNENTLTSLNRGASIGGNLNSSRAGLETYEAFDDAQDELARASVDLRSNAYNNGLALAEQGRATDINAGLNTLSTGAGLIGDANANKQFDVNSTLNASGQLNGALGLATNQATAGAALGTDAANNIFNAGSVQQADAQGRLDEAFQQWSGNDTRASDLLNRYWNIVGRPITESQGQSTSHGESNDAVFKKLGSPF
jgi:hypothetical protein